MTSKIVKLLLAPILGLALLVLTLAVWYTPTLAAGTIYFVDAVNGDDGNTGTAPGAGNAWKTISHAVANVPAGVAGNPNIIMVAAGAYDQPNLGETFPITFTNNYVTLQGNGAGTIVDGTIGVGVYVDDLFHINAEGITIDQLTLQDANQDAIFAYTGNFTVTNNTISNVTNGLNLTANETPGGDYTIGDITVLTNTMVLTNGVRLDVKLNFSSGDGAVATLGNINVSGNDMTLANGGTGIYLNTPEITQLDNGQITVGGTTITANTITGGKDGITYLGKTTYISNTVVTVGPVVIDDNILQNQSLYGIYSAATSNKWHWYGASSGTYGDLSIRNNTSNVRVLFQGYAGANEIYGTTTVTYGDISITGNNIVANGEALTYDYFEAYRVYDDSSVTVGDLLIQGNHLTSTSSNTAHDGMEIGVDQSSVYNNAVLTAGQITIIENTITTAGGGGIFVDLDYIGQTANDDSLTVFGDVTVANNTVDAGGNGVYVSFEEPAYYSFDNFTISIGDVVVSGNTITGTTGVFLENEFVAYELYGTGTVDMGKFYINNNEITANGLAGIHFYTEGGYTITGTVQANVGGSEAVGNHISAAQHGIMVHNERVGNTLEDSAVFTLTETIIRDNTIETSSSTYAAVYVLYDQTGKEVVDNAQVSVGDVWVDGNDIIGGSESVKIDYTDTNHTNAETATVELSSYHLVNNVLTGAPSGVRVNGNAPVNLIHNTIVNPVADGSLTGVTVLTGTVQLTNTIIATFSTGINHLGGTVSEDYTLFAGVGDNISGTVTTGTHSISNGNPAFTNPANNDYTLLEGSNAIDKGVDAGITVDKANNSRPRVNGYDIGAFEWSGFTLTIGGGNNQSAEINTALAQALQVMLVGSDTNAGVPGQVITFTAPSSGASLSETTLTATTNISGVVSLTPTVNGLTGSYVVTASHPAVSEAITFTLQNYALYTLTTASGGNGSGSVTAGDVYTNGETVTITATASTGSYFAGWTGDASGTTNPLAVTMDSDKAITATFDMLTHTLTVVEAGSGSGTVTVAPDQTSYDYGTVVTLTATANTGSSFGGWAGDVIDSSQTITVTMTGDVGLFASFNLLTHTLTVVEAGSGSGTVTVAPDQTSYDYGTVVTLTATASTGSYFTGWSGDATGTTNPLAVTMDSDKAITATFNLDSTPPTLLDPADGSVISTTLRPTFTWTEPTDGDTDGETSVVSYTLVITGSSSVQTIPTTGTTYTPSTDLATGVYTWTVQAHDATGNVSGYTSPPFSFTIEAAGTEVFLPIVVKNN